MPLNTGDPYIASETHNEPLGNFTNAWIAVEATYYISKLLNQKRSAEPLIAALGGQPLALRKLIEADLSQWSAHNINPYFVFDGQALVGEKEMSLRVCKRAVDNVNAAWALYENNQATAAVQAFGSSGGVQPKSLYSLLFEILTDLDLKFMIVPFSACAQMAYFEKTEFRYCDGIMGSDELLLYDIHDCVIKSFDFERNLATGVVKSELCRKLKVDPAMFEDALLMSGTSFLPPFPGFPSSTAPRSVKDAINLLRTTDKSVMTACTTFSDVVKEEDPLWLDKYQKAKLSIKHHIVINEDGTVFSKDVESLTGDHHQYTGLRLPDELYAYLQKGAIGPQAMDWLSFSEIIVLPPLDGGDYEEYRRLVSQQLVLPKRQALALYQARLNRGIQFKKITMRFPFGIPDVELDQMNVEPRPTSLTGKWCVEEVVLKELLGTDAAKGAKPGTLTFALASLQDAGSAGKTLSGEPKILGIKTLDEILANIWWRFLHLRGYVRDDHQLSGRGKALVATLQALEPSHKLEEAAFLAFELLHYDSLNTRHSNNWIGLPQRGDASDRACNLLIARVSSLVKLRHGSIGYTGPLSKNLLAFHSITSAIRESDRTLVEAILASMLLHGHVAREGQDYTKIGRSLPFSTNADIALGIAVKTYLDDHCKPNSTAETKAAEMERYVQSLLPYSIDFPGDLEKAFSFFDAVFAGVQHLSDEMSQDDLKAWEDAHAWLAKRR